MTKWHVGIVGAGKIGVMIAALLKESGDYTIAIFDQNEDALKALKDVERVRIDVSDEDALAAALGNVDAVLSAAPFFLTPVIARAAKRSDTHYLDLTEDVSSTNLVMDLAKDASSAFAPQCGLAPGFVSIAAHDLARKFDKLENLTLRVGALPRYPTNRLKYNLTWSTEGLINEYCNPCLAIVDGTLTEVAPLEGLETFSLEGVDYEAFNTSGGLGSLHETLRGKVNSLKYLSIRYPGHREIISLLLQDLGLKNRRDLLKEVMETALPTTKQDVVVVFITASGMIDGRLEERSYLNEINAGQIAGTHWSAIQITTAAGICATLDMIREGRLAKSGFIKQEDIPLEAFLANRFGALYLGHRSIQDNGEPKLLAAE
ncbi:saccharopine dehydrogenase C-terminal domain-containing protein [Pseudovibrio exalbescens]|uniref:saccharopine dehydrogenase family protein n=1 Tax=Pseudovibrio exalbescens TaxID=197461 RepID=UPI0023661C37|nr:saccharopine dehydrogenase C-terminal domain-containing protein [Pseudovibrio exalbescens]MDD7909078.1 saccharopine dehydrogenase C-terminal domain-containing protein [Pseudovibrio exalbescens]